MFALLAAEYGKNAPSEQRDAADGRCRHRCRRGCRTDPPGHLYHDDVMDEADRARGAERKRTLNSVAILAGDYIRCRLPADGRPGHRYRPALRGHLR